MTISLGNSQSNLASQGGGSGSGTPPNGVDQLSELQQFAWTINGEQTLYFPVVNIKTNISHDLAVHKYPDLDAARVENVGRNPIEVTAAAIFVNTITPGPKEQWIAGTLYPNVYQKVLQAALSRLTGNLQHPFIGTFTAKLVSADSIIDADFRGGEVLQLHFIETINQNNILTTIQSTTPQVTAAASTLDNQLQSLSPFQLAQLSTYGFDPTIMAAILQSIGIATTASLLFTNLATAIQTGNLPIPTQLTMLALGIQQSNLLIQSLQSINDNSYANIFNASWVNLATLQYYQQLLNTNNIKNVLIYNTIKPSSLSTIASILNSSLSDLITLNPNLLIYPTVPQGLSVKYYG